MFQIVMMIKDKLMFLPIKLFTSDITSKYKRYFYTLHLSFVYKFLVAAKVIQQTFVIFLNGR